MGKVVYIPIHFYEMCIYLIEENKSNIFPNIIWATMLMDGPQEHNNQSAGYILKLKLYRCHVAPTSILHTQDLVFTTNPSKEMLRNLQHQICCWPFRDMFSSIVCEYSKRTWITVCFLLEMYKI